MKVPSLALLPLLLLATCVSANDWNSNDNYSYFMNIPSHPIFYSIGGLLLGLGIAYVAFMMFILKLLSRR